MGMMVLKGVDGVKSSLTSGRVPQASDPPRTRLQSRSNAPFASEHWKKGMDGHSHVAIAKVTNHDLAISAEIHPINRSIFVALSGTASAIFPRRGFVGSWMLTACF